MKVWTEPRLAGQTATENSCPERRARRAGWVSLLALAAGCLGIAAPATAGVPVNLEWQLVTGGFVRPVTVRHAGDGTGRLFIVEQRGVIRIYDTVSGTLLPTPFLDIDPLVDSASNEQGLLGIDFHPDFENNGFFYVNYTRDPGPGLDRTVIARYSVSGANPNVADPGSAVTLLEIEQDFSNHNGGNILFGPDGYLYIGMGDGGSGGDPNNRAQTRTNLLGTMLRIDVDGAPEVGEELCGLVQNYGIPDDNPYAGTTGGAGLCDEIWAYGIRNPWRFSFDRLTGDLIIGDVGQNAIEEVDFQPAASTGGENYGWSCMEGNNTPNFNACDGAPLVGPIFQYTHAFGFSITGGYRYRGPISSVQGTYWVADYVSGRFWYGEETSPGNWAFVEWDDTTFNPASFGEDELGHMYMADFATNAIYRLGLAGGGIGRVPDGTDAPDEPLTVELLGGGDLLLRWDASCVATDPDYAVYEGLIGDFTSHKPRTCTTGGGLQFQVAPNSGNRYYLVVPQGVDVEGSHGLRSGGLERPVGSTVCADQSLAVCP